MYGTAWSNEERARARDLLETHSYNATALLLNEEFWGGALVRTFNSVRGQVTGGLIQLESGDRRKAVSVGVHQVEGVDPSPLRQGLRQGSAERSGQAHPSPLGEGEKANDDTGEGETAEFKDRGNEATLIVKTREEVVDREEIIRRYKIDTEVWLLDWFRVKSWPTTMKFGKPGGEKAVQVDQFYIEAKFIRKVPVKHEWPVIQPVKMHRPLKPRFGRAKGGGYPTVLILPDSQNGYWRDINNGYLKPMHDRRAWDVALQVAHTLKPDRIILLGDMLDMPELTDKYIKMPEFYFTTQAAVEELHWWLAQLADTGAQVDYLEGNHEFRLTRAVVNNIIAAYRLRQANRPDAPDALSVENLLSLRDLGIRYHRPYPEAHIWLNDNLRVSHGELARKGSGDTVKEVLKEARNSEVAGHSHRLEMAGKTVHPRKGARVYIAYNLGTLARIDPGAVPASGSKQNWQQGIGTGWYQSGGDHLHEIYLHPIYGGRMMYQGRLLQARENLDRLVAEATGVGEFVAP